MVFVPLIAGVAIFALFILWESRYRHAMLDLSLFKVRNFAITNIETLVVYAGLFGAFFFITLFLQQTAGYSPIAAGFATTPVSLVIFVLSPRFGKIVDRDRSAGADVHRPDRRRDRPAAADASRRRPELPHRGSAGDPRLRSSGSRPPWRP